VAREVDAIWARFEQEYEDDPLGELNAWVRVGAECVVGDGRGCDLANAAVELAESDHPARHVIEEFKRDQRNRLADLCRKAGVDKAELLADTLSLLLEGARVSRQSVGAEGPAARFVAIGEAVIAAFVGEGQARKRAHLTRTSQRQGKSAVGRVRGRVGRMAVEHA